MKLGFMTNVLVKHGMKDFGTIADWAVAHGFTDMEVGPTIPLDRALYEKTMNDSGIHVSALTYCRNYLSSDPEEAANHIDQLKRRIRFASELGIGKIVTSTGIDKRVQEGIYDSADSIRKTPAKSLDMVTQTFLPIVELAEKCGVKLAFENCPLMGNIAISPVMWRQLLRRLDSDCVGLAYDPSHLVWQMIDPYEYICEFAPKIFHVHAKDMHVNWEKLRQTGFLTDFSWWEARIPGHGDVDWARFIGLLGENGFDGTISIEHEDHDYEGTLERVQAGILEAKEHLQPIIGR